ncbi:MAG: RHS repeat-associated core domain-containing protein [Gemmatimonadetes bacterium]|nr:RHS repeat-associated core domain-containing protein [Gemmatimonadota bacterium]
MAQAAPVAAIDVANSGYPIERSACLSVNLGANAATDCGDLRVTHPLSSVRAFDTEVTPTLLYNSQFAHPRLSVPVTITQLATTTQPDSVELRLCRAPYNAPPAAWTCVTSAWRGTDWPAGTTAARRVTITADAINDTTGVYSYYVKPANWYGLTRVPRPDSIVGGYHHVNRSNSPYGAGWWLVGLDRVKKYYQSGGTTALLWVGGDGSTRTFTVGQAMYYDRLDSITYDAAQQAYVRRLPEGRRTEFDLQGRHIRTINRFGRVTVLSYVTTADSAGVATMTLPSPTGMSFGFSYTNGRLAVVTPPALGSTGMQIRKDTIVNTAGNVVRVRNASDSSVQFAYYGGTTTQYVLRERKSRRAVAQTFTFDAAFKARSASVAPGFGSGVITTTVVAGESRGLPQSGSPAAVDTARAYTWVDGPRAVADTSALFQGRFGEVRRMVDPIGAVTQVRAEAYFDGWQFGWKPTRVRRPGGHVVFYEWDDRGNVLRVIDSTGVNAGVRDTTQYVYETSFDQLTHVIPPLKDTVRFGVSAVNGRRDWQQDQRGITSRVNYIYSSSYPEELVTLILPAINGTSAYYNYGYHATTRNNVSEQTPKGNVTTRSQDAIGRDTLIVSPIDSLPSSTRRLRERIVHTIRGDITLRATFWTNGASPSESLSVHTYYDPDGQIDSVSRRGYPDSAGVGTMTTRWGRDSVGRAIFEQSPDGRRDSVRFDEAGNAVKRFSRRWASNNTGVAPESLAYDVRNKLSWRVIPGVTYPARAQGIGYNPGPPYPAYVIARDSLFYTYTPDGDLATATNRYARVRRGYSVAGRLLADTLEIADVAVTTFAQHLYATQHRYDRNGRRIVLKVPSQLTTNGQDSIRYGYAFWGSLLTQVVDPQGNSYTYTYNVRNEPTSLYSPTSAMQHEWRYDDDGRLVLDSVRVTSGAFPYFPFAIARRSALRYDGRDKLLRLAGGVGSKDTSATTYSGLGYLIADSLVQRGIGYTTGDSARYRSITRYRYDGLGNIIRRTYADTLKFWVQGQPYVRAPVYDSSFVTYRPGVGRDTLDFRPSQGPTKIVYDSSGNVVYTARTAGYASQAQEDRASFYDAAGRLVAADRRYMSNDGSSFNRSVLEEYRHDALGRRVWVRGQRACSVGGGPIPPAECLASYIRRTTWDGAQELAEIQAPGGATDNAFFEQDVGAFTLPYLQNQDRNPFYGRVLYTHGAALDQPLAVARYGYVDLPVGGTPTPWPDFVVEVSWDPRGRASFGSYGGLAYKQLSSGGTKCVWTPATSAQRCVQWDWPGARAAYNPQQGVVRSSWMGTLLEEKQDGAGTLYRRNRQYDPTRGRFAQEDPIGLAGGLNLYGYANGDPVNFSDPFGLCPERDPNCKEFTGADARAVFRALAGMAPAMEQGLTIAGAVNFAPALVMAAGGGGFSTLGLSAQSAAAGAGLGIVPSAIGKVNAVASQLGTSGGNLLRNILARGEAFVDTRNSNNINVLLQRPDGASGFVRATLDPTGSRVISSGMMRADQVKRLIESGKLVPK